MHDLQEGLQTFAQHQQIAELRQKYRSLGAYDNHAKINMVKDTSLNPFLFEDPFDGLTNSLSRWTQEAPAFANKDQATRTKVASDYYDNVILPMYQQMKVSPLDKDTWMSQAWGQALKYDPAQSYHSGLIHGLIESLPGTIAPAARAGQFVLNILGLPVAAFADSVRNGDYSGLTGFANLFMNLHNKIAGGEGIFKSLSEEGEKAPLIGEWGKFEKSIANYNTFWHDVTPNRSFTEKATSFIAENALLLPLFGGLSAANEAGIGLIKELGEGVPFVENLTEALRASKAGQFSIKALTAGSEGLMWGVLTRKDDDKKNAWEDALNFAAMGSVFSLLKGRGKTKITPEIPTERDNSFGNAGAGRIDPTPRSRPGPGSALSRSNVLEGEYLWDHEPVNLHEMMPSGDPERAELIGKREQHRLGAGGEHAASEEEAYEDHRIEMAHNISIGGIVLQHTIFEEALDHAATWGQNIDTPETQAFMKKAVERDPARWKPVFSSMNLIFRWLKYQGLNYDVVRNSDKHPAEFQRLIEFLKAQSSQAAESDMVRHVQSVRQAAAMDFINNGAKVSPQQADGFIQKGAEDQQVTGSVNTANSVPKEPPRRRINSRFEYDSKGNPTAYSLNISYDWKVAKNNLAKAKGGSNTNQFWKDFVDSTTGQTDDPETANKAFIEDLRDYFNPLEKAGLKFEKGSKSGGEVEGGDYTNFLGFMYHYKNNLPKPVGDKVEEILMNSPKMAQILGSRPTENKLEMFAQAIQNHIDMFMRSKWYQDKGERNIFRSTQPTGNDKTKWQLDLLKDTWKNDLKLGTSFYPGRSKASLAARETYNEVINGLYASELEAFTKGDEKQVSKLMNKIRQRISKERGTK